jgi:predicted aconitase
MSAGVAKPIRAIVFVMLALFAAGVGAEGAAPFRVAQSQTTQDRTKQITAADTEIRVARDELTMARRRFESGRKPTAADRVNQLEGGGPHTDAYYLRVEQLKADVVKAQQRLDRAITARKAIAE